MSFVLATGLSPVMLAILPSHAAQRTSLSGVVVSPPELARPVVGSGFAGLRSDRPLDLAQAAPVAPAPQAQPTREPTPEELARFTARFQADVAKGCLNAKSKAFANPRVFCECYAAAFVKRYQAIQLANIETVASRSPLAAQVIAVMMDPERQACAAKAR